MMRSKVVKWFPRIVALLFAAFLSLFAFDVFADYQKWTDIVVALFMHLIPVFILLIAIAIAWKWHRIGGVLFILLGIVTLFFFKTYQDIIVLLMITAPPIILGLLFYLQADDPQQKSPAH